MAGRPLISERRRIARESLVNVARKYALDRKDVDAAIWKAAKEGGDPVHLFEPVAKALWDQALTGDVAAIKELYDRTEGKVAQEIQVDRTETHGVDAGLVGAMQDLLRLAGKKTAPVLEKVINHEPLPSHLPEPTEPGPWEKP